MTTTNNIKTAELQSLDFTIKLTIKLFIFSNIPVIKDCQYFFGFELPSSTVKVKFERFLLSYKSTENDFL